MSLKISIFEEVLLISDYNNYPRGTVGYYLGHFENSGHNVPMLVIKDRASTAIVNKQRPYITSQIDVKDLFVHLECFRPNNEDIITLKHAKDVLEQKTSEFFKAKDLFDFAQLKLPPLPSRIK